jgi:hypothetical protein
MNRYESTNQITGSISFTKRYETTTYPKLIKKEDDVYIISKKLDRLDLLADKYYNDSRFWWIIALANNLGKGTLQIPAGRQIRIPADIYNIYADLLTAKEER